MDEKRQKLLSLPGVVGIGHGKKEKKGKTTKKDALIVFVEKKLPPEQLQSDELVPQFIDDTPTDVIEIGELYALEKPPQKKSNYEILYNFLASTSSNSIIEGRISPFTDLIKAIREDLGKVRLIKATLAELNLPDYKKVSSVDSAQEVLVKLSKDLERLIIIAKVLSDINLTEYKRAFKEIRSSADICELFPAQLDFLRRIWESLFRPSKADRKTLMRPAQPGVSIGHYKGGAGTFGALVYSTSTNEPLILSNNHVLAKSTMVGNKKAKVGDSIVQPARGDGSNTEIAKLAKIIPLKLQPDTNVVDCALARPLNRADVDPEILEIGAVKGVVEPVVGMKIQKSGRTTGHTTGKVRAVQATVKVNYGDNKVLIFEDQIVANSMSKPGDSGSLVLDMKNRAVGLLFAGSDLSTVINPIKPVLEMLEVRF
ncbi:MAG: hypothetical protein GX351_09835 [Peptococcaceae bacterium]|nr:hypothetical protein [Peptococcaceae bacterium]